jgi:hypothetical protein
MSREMSMNILELFIHSTVLWLFVITVASICGRPLDLTTSYVVTVGLYGMIRLIIAPAGFYSYRQYLGGEKKSGGEIAREDKST